MIANRESFARTGGVRSPTRADGLLHEREGDSRSTVMSDLDHIPPQRHGADPAAVIATWAIAQRAEGIAATTVEIRRVAVTVAARHAGCSPLALSTDGLRAFLADLTAPWTRSTYHAGCKAWSKWLLAEGYRPDDPTAAIRNPKVPRGAPRPCTSSALRAMLALTGRRRAVVILGAYQGLRAAEIAAVAGEDLDLAAATMRVLGKGGVTSVLPLHPLVAGLAAAMPPAGWWFPSRRVPGEHITPHVITMEVRAACRAAGVPEHGAHRLRHWFASELIRSGADLPTTQSLMRHASPATTVRYVEVVDEVRAAAVCRLPDLGGDAA